MASAKKCEHCKSLCIDIKCDQTMETNYWNDLEKKRGQSYCTFYMDVKEVVMVALALSSIVFRGFVVPKVNMVRRWVLKQTNTSVLQWYLRIILFVDFSFSQAFEIRPTMLLAKQAVVGHSVHLPCELPSLRDNPSLILWYKNQSQKPFYIFDAREMKVGQHKVHDQFNLGGRTNFTYGAIPYATKVVLGHLLITNLTSEDEGNFTCRVDFQKAQTVMTLLELKVLKPIWRLAIVDAHQRELDKETGPYLESERLYLTCMAYGGDPPPLVEWMSHDEVIASSSLGGRHNQANYSPWRNASFRNNMVIVEAVLQFPVLKREDYGRSFTCRANNSNLTPVRTKTITLNMSLRPIHIEIEGPSEQLWSGREVEFLCRSKGSRPPAQLTWSPQGIFEKIYNQTSLDMRTVVSRATLIPGPDDDGRSINCTATNSLVPKYSLSTTKQLVVKYAPQVEAKLASFLMASNIKEGDDVYFECIYKANPRPRKMVWLHEGTQIYEDRSKGILVQGHNLVLQQVSRLSRGRFQCRATNAVATVTSQPVVLDVMFLPECSEPRNVTVSVSSDEEVRLNCSVYAFPHPEEFIWKMNGSSGWETIDQRQIDNSGSWSTLTFLTNELSRPKAVSDSYSQSQEVESILNLERISNSPYLNSRLEYYERSRPRKGIPETASNDNVGRTSSAWKKDSRLRDMPQGSSYGVIYCLARNRVGRQKEPCIFNIIPAGPPGDLVSCSLGNQSATSLAISCIPGHDGGIQQIFQARVVDEQSKTIVANMTSRDPQILITGLAPGQDYLVMVTAVNSKGSSRPYILEEFALKVAENKINEYSTTSGSPLIGVFVGVVTGFVFALGILLLATRARCRRRSIKSKRRSKGQITDGDEDLSSPASNVSLNSKARSDANEEGTEEGDSCLQALDISVETSESLSSIGVSEQEKCLTRGSNLSGDDFLANSPFASSSSTPPPLLGLSNTYRREGGLPRAGSNYGFGTTRDNSATLVPISTLPSKPYATIQQPLHSKDLPHVTSNANKYYTLKINCTRQNNESFV